ncbi:subtilisin family serine protease, partial [Symbiobacterium terraclitae]
MGVAKRILSSLVTASMLVSIVSGLALANSPDLPEREAPRAPVAERATPGSQESKEERRAELEATGKELQRAADVLKDGLRQYFVELEAPSGVEMQVQARQKGLLRQDLRSHLNSIEREQRDVIQAIRSLKKSNGKIEVLYQVRNVLNGIVVRTNEAGAEQIRALPGVKSVSVMQLHERAHTGSVPLIGGPEVWQSFGVLGEGIKVAVIDTGIDYLHTNFGGPGTPEAYELDTTTLNEYFPNAKVAGGWDFAGDDYDPRYDETSIPQPDPNPLDCPAYLGGGHGTHVAGTIAGYGVNADGSTYRGPYDRTIPMDSLRIGPGVAPLAELYALRIFGCDGPTGLTIQALDWIVDPNGDGDYSDRMDVANLSLGSPVGGPDDPTARAANNAALAGVLLAIAAGNEGDVYYVMGSPGSATRAVTVAAQVDARETLDMFRVDSPASISGLYPGTVGQNYNWAAVTEPVTAPVVYDPDNPAGCNPWPDGALDGRIVLVDWVPPGASTYPCGSAARANNAAAAGAVGIIMADSEPYLTVAIAGNALIPSILTVSTAGDAIKSELGSGVVATLSSEWLGAGKEDVPERNDTMADFSSRGPVLGNRLKPDISAPGYTIYSAMSGTGTLGVSSNGTSMAAPHMAGVLALLREKNPDWTVEEIKALAMNTAGHDLFDEVTGERYGQSRVGAGRVNAARAIGQEVVAFSADDPGAVSVSFGALEVVGTQTFERRVKVVNHGDRAVTYRPSIDMYVEIPGLEYSFPDGDVTVPAGGSATFRVRLTADASQMLATHDPTVSETQFGYPRVWLPEHSGVILLKPVNSVSGAKATLRVPVYATARPAADVRMEDESVTYTSNAVYDVLPMTGTGLATGGFSRYDYNAIVTPFELQHVGTVQSLDKASGIGASAISGAIQYAGVTTDSLAVRSWGLPLYLSELYFGIVAHADWSTPLYEVMFTVEVKPEGSDQIYTLEHGGAAFLVGGNVELSDIPLVCTVYGCDISANGFSPTVQTGVFNNNVIILHAFADELGLSNTRTRFQWRVVSEHWEYGVIDETPWYTYDYANPGLDFTDGAEGQPTYFADPGRGIPVAFNRAA